jgi:hypothetical protein
MIGDAFNVQSIKLRVLSILVVSFVNGKFTTYLESSTVIKSGYFVNKVDLEYDMFMNYNFINPNNISISYSKSTLFTEYPLLITVLLSRYVVNLPLTNETTNILKTRNFIL